MLEITIPDTEYYDASTNSFTVLKGGSLQLEHSLLSISKWEAKWEKPFLSKDSKTIDETVDYIRCMTLNPKVNSEIYSYLTADNINDVRKYIDAKMTATWFNDNTEEGSGQSHRNSEKITSELIYYWMITYGIPFECQKWHLNRLLTLIKVCGLKNSPSKKMSKRQTASQYAALNAARRNAMHSKG